MESQKLHVINKWDAPTVKNSLNCVVRMILNDKVGWNEKHTIADTRLLISFICVAFSVFGCGYHYYVPLEQCKMVLAVCSFFYFFFSAGILTLFEWYVEKEIFYEAIENDGRQQRRWAWSSNI